MTIEELRAGAGTSFLFHYTDAVKADLIVEDRLFVAGVWGAHGFGVYATDIAPLSAETIDEVIVNCFGGAALPPELNHAIAVRMEVGGLRFEQTSDPYQWLLSTSPLEYVHLDELYVATASFDGSGWVVIDEGD